MHSSILCGEVAPFSSRPSMHNPPVLVRQFSAKPFTVTRQASWSGSTGLRTRTARSCSTALLVQQRTIKDWYTTAEAAELLSKAEFTVREWCRLKRIDAQKRPCGRGRSRDWMISHAELDRYRNEGLLPLTEH